MKILPTALFLCTALHVAAASAQCRLEKIGEWTVRLAGNQPVIDGAINGQKVGILLDTGAQSSLMTRDGAERLKLPRQKVYGIRVYGVGGESTPEAAEIAEFRLGEAVRKDWKVLVVESRTGPRFSFILGDDFFEQMELELDLPHNTLRFFLAKGCEKTSLAYWNPKDAVEVPLEGGSKIQFTTELNGVSVRTLLDTGASTSVVALTAARGAGFDPDAPGVMSAGCSGGIGARTLDSWYASFDRLVIGNQAIRNPTLRVSDLWRNVRRAGIGNSSRPRQDGMPDMLLGMDFLKTHRVFISRTQRRMYFTHEGGLVFPTSPAVACEGLSTEKEAPARIAEYSARIAANGKDVQALLNRSSELNRSGDKDGALRDLDALLAIEPSHAVARTLRAQLLMQRKEPAKALADYDAAIAGGVNTARIHALRGIALRQTGDKARAIESFEAALRLDPREPSALYWRGVHRVETADKAGAQADLELLEKLQAQGAAALRKRIAGESGEPPGN